MTRFVKQRSMAACFLFLAGAAVGGMSSTLFRTQDVTAAPLSSNGIPLKNQQEIAKIKSMLSGLMQTQEGTFVFNRPVEFRDPTKMTELLVECSPESPKPALSVCGRSVFTGDPGPDDPLVSIDLGMLHPGQPALKIAGPTTISFPGVIPPSQRPLLSVSGTVDIVEPVEFPGVIQPKLRLLSADRAMCLKPDRVELLVECTPDAELLGGIRVLSDGTTLLQATEIEAVNVSSSEIEAASVDADTITADTVIADTFFETGGGGYELPN